MHGRVSVAYLAGAQGAAAPLSEAGPGRAGQAGSHVQRARPCKPNHQANPNRLLVVAAYKNPAVLPGEGRNQVVCDYNNLPRDGQVCSMNMDNWGRCTERYGYGYNQSSPCVFVKLNKVRCAVPWPHGPTL